MPIDLEELRRMAGGSASANRPPPQQVAGSTNRRSTWLEHFNENNCTLGEFGGDIIITVMICEAIVWLFPEFSMGFFQGLYNRLLITKSEMIWGAAKIGLNIGCALFLITIILAIMKARKYKPGS